MGNAFIKAASKAKRVQEEQLVEMRDEVVSGGAGSEPSMVGGDADKVVVMTVRVPADLHRKAMQHRIDSGESITKLVVRLLSRELG